MPLHVLRANWPTQPQEYAVLDRARDEFRGLAFAVDAGQGTAEQLSGLSPISFKGLIRPNQYGVGAYLTGAVNDNWQWGDDLSVGSSPVNAVLSGSTEYTLDLTFRPVSTGITPHLIGQWNLGSGNHWLVQQNGTGLIWVAAEDGSANRRRWDASSLFTAGRVHRLILSWQGGANKSAWLDGVDITASLTAVNTAASSVRVNPFALRICGFSGGTPSTDVSVARVWTRGFTTAQMAALASAAPHDFYEPQRWSEFYTPAAPGGPVLSAATVFNITATTAQPRVTITF